MRWRCMAWRMRRCGRRCSKPTAQLDAFPDAAPALAALRGQGIATAILSNGSPEMLDAAVAAAGLAPLLDAVLSVHPLRCFKPDARVYALATARFGCAPAEVAFISSNAWDAYAAVALRLPGLLGEPGRRPGRIRAGPGRHHHPRSCRH